VSIKIVKNRGMTVDTMDDNISVQKERHASIPNAIRQFDRVH
jgi:hypothetical protein